MRNENTIIVKTESQILADMMDQTRYLTKIYLKPLKELDWNREALLDGQRINTVHWIMGHLCWAEPFLILQGTGATYIEPEWMKHFRLGSDATDSANAISKEEILNQFYQNHKHCMNYLREFPVSKLDHPNAFHISFGQEPTNRLIIQHCIRHEATHAGHLGWWCKIHGIKIA